VTVIGVFALQGNVREHLQMLAQVGVEARPVLNGGIPDWEARGGPTVGFRGPSNLPLGIPLQAGDESVNEPRTLRLRKAEDFGFENINGNGHGAPRILKHATGAGSHRRCVYGEMGWSTRSRKGRWTEDVRHGSSVGVETRAIDLHVGLRLLERGEAILRIETPRGAADEDHSPQALQAWV